MQPLIYLAGRYTGTPEEQQQRYEGLVKACAYIISHGHRVICPVVHYHPVFLADTSGKIKPEFQFWQELNDSFIAMADVFCVYCTKDWHYSKGVSHEIFVARTLKKPMRSLIFIETTHVYLYDLWTPA